MYRLLTCGGFKNFTLQRNSKSTSFVKFLGLCPQFHGTLDLVMTPTLSSCCSQLCSTDAFGDCRFPKQSVRFGVGNLLLQVCSHIRLVAFLQKRWFSMITIFSDTCYGSCRNIVRAWTTVCAQSCELKKHEQIPFRGRRQQSVFRQNFSQPEKCNSMVLYMPIGLCGNRTFQRTINVRRFI